jgi:alcohol/geraniol dehydrogenase (NADP+)
MTVQAYAAYEAGGKLEPAGEKSIGGSPIGGPAEILMMLDFCSRHAIEPITEEFPFSRVNEALANLESGKARYRIVLRNDFKYLE